jgi:hypothetical protein
MVEQWKMADRISSGRKLLSSGKIANMISSGGKWLSYSAWVVSSEKWLIGSRAVENCWAVEKWLTGSRAVENDWAIVLESREQWKMADRISSGRKLLSSGKMADGISNGGKWLSSEK